MIERQNVVDLGSDILGVVFVAWVLHGPCGPHHRLPSACSHPGHSPQGEDGTPDVSLPGLEAAYRQVCETWYASFC